MSWLMCFGGGVFFATYILHMTTEVRLILEPALMEQYNINYPVPELLMAVGFFIVMFLEIVAMDWGKRHDKRNQHHLEATPMEAISDNKLEHEGTQSIDKQFIGNVEKGDTVIDITSVKTPEKHAANYDVPVISQPDSHHGGVGHGNGLAQQDMTDPNHLKQHQRQTLILAVALSVHRIFEGLAIGLASSKQTTWNLTLAVAMHETIISFGLGLQFVRNKFKLKMLIIFALVCSLFEPIGAAVGTVMSECGGDGNTIEIINGVVQAISTGTFIYVTFFEILAEEIGHDKASKARFLCLVVGFACMAALNGIPEDTDSEDVLHEHVSS